MYYTTFYETELSQDTRFEFIVLGDFGELNPMWNYKELPCKTVAKSIKNTINSEKISFILSVGDNIYSLTNPEYFQNAEKIFSHIYKEIINKIPFYISFGNHDYYLSRSRGDLVNHMNKNLLSIDAPSYKIIEMLGFKVSFTFLPCDLICHGNNEGFRVKHQCNRMDARKSYSYELDWLKEHLEEIKQDKSITWKIVVMHYPIFSIATSGGDSENLKKSLLPILHKYKIDLLLTGHNHNMQHFFYNYSSKFEYRKQDYNESCFLKATINCGKYILRCMKKSDSCPDKSRNCQKSWTVDQSSEIKEIKKVVYKKGEGMHQVVQGSGGSDLDPMCPNTFSSMAENLFGRSIYGFSKIVISRKEINIQYIRAEDDLSVFESRIINVIN